VPLILDLLKPAPHLPEIQDPQVVKERYTYWRFRILSSIFIGYAFYYLTRKSFTFAMPGIIEDLGFDKAELGFLGTIFSLTYGISKFTSGMMSDRSNPRYFMAFGLILTGFTNIFFGMSSSLLMFAIFWGLNGWFQGFGAPPCVRFLTQWFSHTERGSWWSTWSVSHNVGAFAIPWIVGWCLEYLGWRWGLYIPGVICIIGGLFLINRLRDSPQSLGLPPIAKYHNDYGDVTSIDDTGEQEKTAMQVLVQSILKNKYIWLLTVAYFFVYIVRMGIGDWTALYLFESKGYSKLGASGCASLFEVGGFCGALFAGWSSDRLFSARRAPINILFSIAIVLAVFFFWSIPVGHTTLDSIAVLILGFTVFGPQMLIGVAAAELVHQNAVATSNGFISLMAYFGAAMAGYPLGRLTQDWGWEGFFVAMVVSSIVTVLALLPMWNLSEAKIESQKAKAIK
jgi:OPA family sugar phosphate sensor protein UhpC-like MFS transporter